MGIVHSSVPVNGVPTVNNIEISIVVPSFNEAENIPRLLQLLDQELAAQGSFEIIIVDDGSTDSTATVLRDAAIGSSAIRFIRLSRNFGHQAALRAGFAHARGNAVICLDADLQHPVELIAKMIGLWRNGNEVVTTTRQETTNLPVIKRFTSGLFYKLFNWLSDTELERGSADFRLLDRKVVNVINDFQEIDLFFRGLIPSLGFKSCNIEYVPKDRLHGVSKYSLRKMVSLGLTGIVAHSMKPLRFAIAVAAILSGLTMLYCVYALVVYFVFGETIPGWASVIISVNFIGSLQLAVLGVIGEYIGRVLRETRHRPPYIVAETNCT